MATPPRRRATDRGFSFIELLAYMAIAALLLLAAIPQYSNYRGQARDSQTLNDVRNVALAIEAWAIDHPGETYPFVNVDWDAGNPTHNVGVLTEGGVKVSPGTHLIVRDRLQYVGYAAPHETLGTSYCIVAFHPGGTKYTQAGNAANFSSLDGGLGQSCRASPLPTAPAETARYAWTGTPGASASTMTAGA